MTPYTKEFSCKTNILHNVEFARTFNRAGNEETLFIDIYMPEYDNQKKRTLMFVHGGGFMMGNHRDQRYIVALAKIFSSMGYVAVSPDYCLYSPEQADPLKSNGKWPFYTHAARLAARELLMARDYLVQHSTLLGLEPDNISIIGGSAGGMAANIACTDSFRSLVSLWGAPKDLYRISDYPPTLIVHGTCDLSVPFSHAEALHHALSTNGKYSSLIALENAGHTPSDRMDEFIDPMIDFFNRFMR